MLGENDCYDFNELQENQLLFISTVSIQAFALELCLQSEESRNSYLERDYMGTPKRSVHRHL